ncbi:MAG TPA: ribonuclease Y [Gemmatimonadales bacterium]|nr:ribonuclease Y [Gemmatimonadales bacterium]
MSQSLLLPLLEGIVAGLIVAAGALFFYTRNQRKTGQGLLATAQAEAERVRAEAVRQAEATRAQAQLDARVEAVAQREAGEKEVQARRDEVARQERRLEERARGLERRSEELDGQQKELARRTQQLEAREKRIGESEAEAKRFVEEQQAALERVAGLSVDDARRELLQKVEDNARSQAAALARDIKEQARKTADREARRIVSMAVQRIAAEHTAETTVSAVTLPSDEMKGRIIGREGRNIRAFEQVTGVDVIIDDTPDTVVISCFDPIRREVARRALETLIADGRIHPGRIEEVTAKARRELDAQLVEAGEQAAYEAGVPGIHPELIRLLGRMKYRTSYGQNVLDHSKEVAWLAGMMAAELHLDVALAKRAGLLHDVGKVLTHDNEGTHVELGVEVARKYGEPQSVVGIIHAHHDDVPHESTESVLVQAADAISGSRPGARREAYEAYVKRLTRLEEIANGFKGVEKSSVIQAGREVRVIVTPEQIDDAAATELSETIARRIEDELQYPGQIRVVVIRETRAVGIAR